MRGLAACGLLAAMGCSGTVGLEPCDIRRSSCQAAIFVAVQGVRGGGWDPWLDLPEMRVITAEQYKDELEAQRLAEAQSPQEPDYFTPALKAFRLLDPDEAPDGASEFTAGITAAYYDSFTRSVTIIDQGKQGDLVEGTKTLAHELVHAAQDRDIGPAQLNDWVFSIDDSNARGCLVEGEAVLYENLISLELDGIPRDKADFARYHREWLAERRQAVADDPAPLRQANQTMRYPLGSAYMTAAWQAGGPLAVRRTFANHPDDALAFMIGPDRAQPQPSRAGTCQPPRAANGVPARTASALGAWGAYAFATRYSDEPAAWSRSQQWITDVFVVYAKDEQNFAALWKLQFADGDSARAFIGDGSALPEGVTLGQSQRDDVVSLLATVGDVSADGWDWQGCAPR